MRVVPSRKTFAKTIHSVGQGFGGASRLEPETKKCVEVVPTFGFMARLMAADCAGKTDTKKPANMIHAPARRCRRSDRSSETSGATKPTPVRPTKIPATEHLRT